MLAILKRLGLGIAFLAVSLSGQAAMVGTAEMSRDMNGVSVNQSTLQQERLWIQNQLVTNGVSASDSAIRVSQLSDAQVRQIRQQFDEMPAGAGIVGVVAFGAVVLLVTDLMGLTDVYPIVRPLD